MYDGEMSYVCCSLLGKAVDWSIQHLHIFRDTPTCDVRRGRYSKQLVAANPPHTWWYNMSPLRCMSLKRSLHVRTMMDLFYRAPVNGVHSSGWNRNSFILIHHQCLSSCDDVRQIYLLTLNGNINNISGGLELSLVVSVCGMCRVQPQGEIQVCRNVSAHEMAKWECKNYTQRQVVISKVKRVTALPRLVGVVTRRF